MTTFIKEISVPFVFVVAFGLAGVGKMQAKIFTVLRILVNRFYVEGRKRYIKRQSLLLFGSLLLATPVAVQAQFNYTVTNGTITITGYTGTNNVVVIPDTITGLPVTAIDDDAFYLNFRLTSITIPNSVTDIGSSALECLSLTNIMVDPLNSAFSSVDGVLFDKNQTTLIEYPEGKVGSYSIPNSVTNIEGNAFYGCSGLTSLTIPDSVTNIKDGYYLLRHGGNVYDYYGVFSHCTSLTNVTIGNNGNIGNYAFLGCWRLTSVTIPNSVTGIGDRAFSECTSLTSITIPNGVTNIGDQAFSYCTSLTSVTIPDSVTGIGDTAFSDCTSLTSVTIPNSVTSVGDSAFWDCSSLTSIGVDANNSAYSSVDGVLFDKNQTTLIEYPEGKVGSYSIANGVTSIGQYAFSGSSLTNVIIPNSVTNIGDHAFSGCSSLTSVTIGNSVIGVGEFYGCTSLTSVTIPNSVTKIGYSAFWYCTSLTNVYFQGNAPTLDSPVFYSDDNATAYYLPGTTGWSTNFAGIPTALWTLPYPLILNSSLGVRTNQFGFTVSWATNASVVVEGSTDLANSVWSPVATNALIGGTFYFNDQQWTNHPSRFYRVRLQ